MQQFRFHVVGLPHTQVTKEFALCPFTQKVLNFCKMMKSLGHVVYLYGGGDKCETDCDEFISCLSEQKQQEYFGNVDWHKDFFPVVWEWSRPYWVEMDNNAVLAIKQRALPKDFICLIGGLSQKPIADGLSDYTNVEFGIGYTGVFAKYMVFESYTWMHHIYGLRGIENGRNFDCVIPNYYDVNDFKFSDKKDDYFLYIGRIIPRKGVAIAAEVCGKTGKQLIIAGQGVISNNNGIIKTKDLVLTGSHLKYVGTVGVKERSELMGKAKAVFVPTQFIEPFCGVMAEANLCGTPVIATDWGVFTENIREGFNGFRARSLGEFIHAVNEVEKFTAKDYRRIREFAVNKFSMDKVKYLYQAYFEQLFTIWEKGFYSEQDFSEYNRYGAIQDHYQSS